MPKVKDRITAAIDVLNATGSKAAAMGAFIYPSSYQFPGTSRFISVAPRSFPYHNTDPMGNSAVVNTLGWVQRNFGQAHLQLEKKVMRAGKEEEEAIKEHPYLDLLWKPNPHYNYQSFWSAILLSYHLDGNAYAIKVRNARGYGVPTALYYEPHWSLKPHAPSDGSQFIDYYERYVNGTMQKIPVENVIHFRNGLNPANPRYGLAPLKASLLQIFTDDEVSLWVAALCRNMAIPGVVVSPEQPISLGKNGEKAEAIKQSWKRKFGGDNRGEPLILDFPGSVTTLGYNPSDMDFTAISSKAEARISGALGVPAIVAGLSVGMDSSTYNNLANLKKSAFEECLCPTWEDFETTLDDQLLRDFTNDKTLETCFETEHIRALQENETERQDRERKNLEAGGILINEFRQKVGLDPIPQGDVFLIPSKCQPMTADVLAQMAAEKPEPQPAPADPASDPAKGLKKKSLIEWEGLELSREPTDLEKPIIKAIAASMDIGKQSLEGVLLELRSFLIDEVERDIPMYDPENYHALTLAASVELENRVKVLIEQSYRKGRDLVRSELGIQARIAGKAESETDAGFVEKIVSIATVTITRIINELQQRAIEIAAKLVIQFGDDADPQAVKQQLEETSTGYVSKAAQGAANAAIAEGRRAEFDAQKDEIARYIYSAILDTNTCGPCRLADGTESESVTMLAMTPNPLCEGSLLCRCLIIGVLKSEV